MTPLPTFPLDVVSGEIIGGDPARNRSQVWSYASPPDGKQKAQSPMFEGESDAEVRDQALAWVASEKARLGAEYHRLYPRGVELRSWGPRD